MDTSVRTKPAKKQQSFAVISTEAQQARKRGQAVAVLEETVFLVLNTDKGHVFHDVDFLYWNRKLKNVATPVSLALAEYRGLPRFHYHFRHVPGKNDALYPVSGPQPLSTLSRVCREALTDCVEMVGLQDALVRKNRERLEAALRGFLQVR